MTPVIAVSTEAQELIERIRAAFAGRDVREIRMFGAVAMMLDNAMAVAVHKNGSLLVRVDPADDAELLERPGACRAEMGADRTMGAGWIRVEPAALVEDESLDCWLEAATRYLAQRSRAPRRSPAPASSAG
jgi:TfoX/Sxy family transcriptional regulator of competence genes